MKPNINSKRPSLRAKRSKPLDKPLLGLLRRTAPRNDIFKMDMGNSQLFRHSNINKNIDKSNKKTGKYSGQYKAEEPEPQCEGKNNYYLKNGDSRTDYILLFYFFLGQKKYFYGGDGARQHGYGENLRV